jgi:hypothetical protein
MENELTFIAKVRGRDTAKRDGVLIDNKSREVSINMREAKKLGLDYDIGEYVKVTIEKVNM